MIRTDAQRLARGSTLGLLFARPAHADTFTVNNTFDPGGGTCDLNGGCTLREAIEAANGTPGADAIRFNIPGPGVKAISPTSQLPEITGPVIIDGYSQPGASPNTLARGTNALILIQLVGSNAGETSGLDIEAGNVVVRGLAINRWTDGSGIFVAGTRKTGVRIEGNFLGTDPAGNPGLGNRDGGVSIFDASGTTVGSTTPAARNLISGNGADGVSIVGNGFEAITSNKVLGNLIGTQKNGSSALGNSGEGVRISNATGTTVGGSTPAAANTIAFNTEAGVAITGDGSSGNRILGNSIFANGLLGINLGFDGLTLNDPRDPDAGPNRLQNFPDLTSANDLASITIIKGALDSTPSTARKKRTFTIQFFSNDSELEGGGETFLGQKRVTTDRKGVAQFTFKTDRAVGQVVTATATDAKGNTSESSDSQGVSRL